jgi:hypothetical protein
MSFEMGENGVVRKTTLRGAARKKFHGERKIGQIAETFAALMVRLADDGPGGEPGDFFGGHAVETKGQSRAGDEWNNFSEEIEFLG